MIPFAADENFNGNIVRGLRQRLPGVSIVTVQEAGLLGATDQKVLQWAASEGRVLLTHDLNTMTAEAYDLIEAGKRVPGVFVVHRETRLHVVIEDLVLVATCSKPGEWQDQVRYIPLR